MAEAIDRAVDLLRTFLAQGGRPSAIAAAVSVLQAAVERSGAARHQLELQNRQLREALEEAREELRRRDEFLSVVAHELRNPIAPLVFSADVLLTMLRRGNVPDEHVLLRHVTLFRRQLDRLKGDLARLLDFSRVRSGRMDLQLERVDLVEVVAGVLQEMMPQFEAAGSDVRFTGPPSAEGIWDRLRLRQIVWNLASNAAKFGAAAPIHIGVVASDATAVLRVSDGGPGIPEGEHERVFRRFERVSAHQPYTGFGVGLWLVKRIVDASGGTITLDSAPGAGATFTVTLPRRVDVSRTE